MKNKGEVHQAFLPKGFLGAINDNPYKLDVAKAKELLAKAGLTDGFTVTMDTRSTPEITGIAQAIQQTFAQAGVKLETHPGRRQADADQVPRAPARHLYRQLGRGLSGSEHQRRHLRGQRRQLGQREGEAARLAQRLGSGPADGQDPRRRARERDAEKRAAMYKELQKAVLDDGPFVIFLQQIEVDARRARTSTASSSARPSTRTA